VFNENDLKTWSDRHPCDKSGKIKKLKNTSHCVYSQADQMEYKTAVEEAMKLAEEYEMHIETMSCGICGGGADESRMLICDGCDLGYHIYCVTPLLSTIPEGDWHPSLNPHSGSKGDQTVKKETKKDGLVAVLSMLSDLRDVGHALGVCTAWYKTISHHAFSWGLQSRSVGKEC
jgi:hypothetical protein